jgi:hypothetical protein
LSGSARQSGEYRITPFYTTIVLKTILLAIPLATFTLPAAAQFPYPKYPGQPVSPPIYTNYDAAKIVSATDKICTIVSRWDVARRSEVMTLIASVSSLDRDNLKYQNYQRNPQDEAIVIEDANRIIDRFNYTCRVRLSD